MDFKYTSRSENDTKELAENIESEKFPGMIICLNGELGSGKTLFVKGFANALGIEDDITSPTFNIIKEYLDGEAELYHMDVYRVEDNYDSVGIEDYFKRDGICIIEWADMIEEILPKERLDINISIAGENTRFLTLIPHGEKYEELCRSVL